MTITQDPWSNESTDHQTITCPVCGFKLNELGSTNCSICLQSLSRKPVKNQTIKGSFGKNSQKQIAPSRIVSLRDSKRKTTKKQPLQKIRRQITKTIESLPRGNYRDFLSCLINFKTKLITFWQRNKVLTQVKPSYSAPRGLFSYGGASFGSPMVLGELNKAIESTYPDFKWRYTQPFDGNLNSSTGIKMLIEGNLTVAFSTRSVNDLEIERASMRGSNLKQTPIAIDALVFFANNKLSISPNLSLEQISKIYRGEINNWNQISSRAGNIPIVPIFLDNEDINVLGLKQPSPSVQQVSNYNQLLSKVTSTPGAISFLSASLIHEQQLIKIFSLANSDRPSNYIPGLINGQPNLEAFQDGSYPLTRKLFVIYKQDNTFEQNAGEIYVDFLNTKGQKIIEQAGLLPLRL